MAREIVQGDVRTALKGVRSTHCLDKPCLAVAKINIIVKSQCRVDFEARSDDFCSVATGLCQRRGKGLVQSPHACIQQCGRTSPDADT